MLPVLLITLTTEIKIYKGVNGLYLGCIQPQTIYSYLTHCSLPLFNSTLYLRPSFKTP